jgi:hypothetical protein
MQVFQVGNMYFVRDGRYRISAARSLGRQEIEAEVIVWLNSELTV